MAFLLLEASYTSFQAIYDARLQEREQLHLLWLELADAHRDRMSNKCASISA